MAFLELKSIERIQELNGDEYLVLTDSSIGDARYSLAKLKDELAITGDSSFQGIATPTTPAPTKAGYWIVTEAGYYPNFGGFEMTQNSFGFIAMDEEGNFTYTVQPIIGNFIPYSDIGLTIAGLDNEGKISNDNINFGSVSDGDVKPVSGGEVYGQIGTNIASLVGGKVPDEQINIGSVSEGSNGLVRGKDVYDAINPLVYEYTHSGNKEAHITDINYDTNTFTSVGHGLVNSTGPANRIGLVLTPDAPIVFSKLPLNAYEYSVVNATEDTFQLATSAGGTPIVLTNQDTVDYSSFHFERRDRSIINFNNTGLTDYARVHIDMKLIGSVNSSSMNSLLGGYVVTTSGEKEYDNRASYLFFPDNFLLGIYILEVNKYSNNIMFKHSRKTLKNRGEKVLIDVQTKDVLTFETTDLNNITISGLPLANGAKIRLYGK